jgi:hypothetical protein
MAKVDKTTLKKAFGPGTRPTWQDFANLVDSMVHKDEQTAVDQQVVNQAINTYNTNLNGRKPNGSVDSLGDVYFAFNGLDDSKRLVDLMTWNALAGKPASINVQWTEQTVVTDSSTYNPLGSAGSPGSGPSSRWLLGGVGALTGNYLVIDVKTERRLLGSGGDGGYYLDQVTAVKVAVAPKVALK